MRTLAIVALILSHQAACSTAPTRLAYGSFVKDAVPAAETKMANDVVKKLVALYPPARTRVNLRHATPDVFGTSLVDALRKKGYALSEFRHGASADPSTKAASASVDLALAYVVDQPLDARQYRVTVLVNSQLLSRVYRAEGGTVSPDGYWVRKE